MTCKKIIKFMQPFLITYAFVELESSPSADILYTFAPKQHSGCQMEHLDGWMGRSIALPDKALYSVRSEPFLTTATENDCIVIGSERKNFPSLPLSVPAHSLSHSLHNRFNPMSLLRPDHTEISFIMRSRVGIQLDSRL